MGLQGWPLKYVQHAADATGVSPSFAGPPGSCPLHLLHMSNLSFMIWMPNRCCILELRVYQCFVCNFLSVSWCKGQRSSDSLNLELPTEMAEIKVAKKTIFSPRKDSWSSPQIIPKVIFTLDKY